MFTYYETKSRTRGEQTGGTYDALHLWVFSSAFRASSFVAKPTTVRQFKHRTCVTPALTAIRAKSALLNSTFLIFR
jgi:hypothetical protein